MSETKAQILLCHYRHKTLPCTDVCTYFGKVQLDTMCHQTEQSDNRDYTSPVSGFLYQFLDLNLYDTLFCFIPIPDCDLAEVFQQRDVHTRRLQLTLQCGC